MKSFSEIDIISKRASRALGYSWGISEEIGKNIRLLEMFGLNGIKNFNAYCLNEALVIWNKTKNSLSSNILQKIFDGYKVNRF